MNESENYSRLLGKKIAPVFRAENFFNEIINPKETNVNWVQTR